MPPSLVKALLHLHGFGLLTLDSQRLHQPVKGTSIFRIAAQILTVDGHVQGVRGGVVEDYLLRELILARDPLQGRELSCCTVELAGTDKRPAAGVVPDPA